MIVHKRNMATCLTLASAISLGLATSVARAEIADDVRAAEAERIAAIAKASPTFVAIFAKEGQGGGSGVVISPDGYALTNFHVTHEAGIGMKCGMSDGKLYDAVIVGFDPTGDLAMIKLLGREDFPAAELGDSDKIHAGDWCFAAGNPFLLATDYHPSISYGVVSGVHRYQYPSGTLLEYTDCLQVDAAINPGNSGGPLFNAQGQLIGINGRASFEKRGRVNVGVGYAISVNQAKNFIGALKSGRIVDHATLGATVGTTDDGRVLVTDILEDSDAYRRGLREDDEILSFADRPIHTVNAFKNILGIFPKGWRVPLTFQRDGKTFEILVRLRALHHESELLAAASQGSPDKPMPDGPKRKGSEPPKLPEPMPGDRDKKDGDKKESEKKDAPKPDEAKKAGTEKAVDDKPATEKKDADKKQADKPDGGKKDADKKDTDKKDADQKDAEKSKDKDGPKFGGLPFPNPLKALMPAAKPLPEAVTKLYEARTGYANYYFNKLQRERILKNFAGRGDFAKLVGEWSFSGEIAGGGVFDLKLSNKAASIALPVGDTKIDVTDDLAPPTTQLNPPGSGGLLAAMTLWRKLLVAGPGKFGQLVYIGQAPLAGHERMVDVIDGTSAGVDCNFMFDSVDGSLVAIEMVPAVDSDPCEVYFSDYREVEGRFVPGRLEVHYGDNLFGILAIKKHEFKTETDK